MKTRMYRNHEDFLKRADKNENGVSIEFAIKNPDYKQANKDSRGCWNCSNCSRCSDCSRCSGCSGGYDCSSCSGCFDVPAITNIHSVVLGVATETPKSLDMKDWHTCETTHCRAGWVVTLAGRAGIELEKKTSTLFAAMQIYKKSSNIRVPPARFFDSNEEAIADMKRCADLEIRNEKT